MWLATEICSQRPHRQASGRISNRLSTRRTGSRLSESQWPRAHEPPAVHRVGKIAPTQCRRTGSRPGATSRAGRAARTDRGPAGSDHDGPRAWRTRRARGSTDRRTVHGAAQGQRAAAPREPRCRAREERRQTSRRSNPRPVCLSRPLRPCPGPWRAQRTRRWAVARDPNGQMANETERTKTEWPAHPGQRAWGRSAAASTTAARPGPMLRGRTQRSTPSPTADQMAVGARKARGPPAGPRLAGCAAQGQLGSARRQTGSRPSVGPAPWPRPTIVNRGH